MFSASARTVAGSYAIRQHDQYESAQMRKQVPARLSASRGRIAPTKGLSITVEIVVETRRWTRRASQSFG